MFITNNFELVYLIYTTFFFNQLYFFKAGILNIPSNKYVAKGVRIPIP